MRPTLKQIENHSFFINKEGGLDISEKLPEYTLHEPLREDFIKSIKVKYMLKNQNQAK